MDGFVRDDLSDRFLFCSCVRGLAGFPDLDSACEIFLRHLHQPFSAGKIQDGLKIFQAFAIFEAS